MSIGENINSIMLTKPKDVTLIAVSKTRTAQEIEEAHSTGVRDFGENKVQELLSKIDKTSSDIRWHFIGHLQRNKVKYIVGKVYLIHSLDSVNLLEEIEKQYKLKNESAKGLIEVNIGREPSKSGVLIENLEELLDYCEECRNVKILGLMAIIPKGDEVTCKKYFKQMKNLFDNLNKRNFKNIEMRFLSMGMSADYKIAIAEGSNMIRIGEGIFGKRIIIN